MRLYNGSAGLPGKTDPAGLPAGLNHGVQPTVRHDHAPPARQDATTLLSKGAGAQGRCLCPDKRSDIPLARSQAVLHIRARGTAR
jgi:hypothetical protein